ncbi:MAG: hypothetical protein LBG72_09310 [Spirochaetaceae bacterium]|jgi:cell fate regulator YaaT (PSP1 superfamily)|nr:hypothetical protein [Spirochaetaceae bacterium]
MKNEQINDEYEDLDRLEDNELIEDTIVEIESAQLPPDIPIYHLRLACSSETFFAIYKGDTLPPKSQVIVPTRYGRDLAVVIRQLRNDNRKFTKITRIERPATDEDLERARNNARYEEKAFLVCRDLIEEHGLTAKGLSMKLLTAHYLLEEPKIVFFYTAEKRVDFRALLKDLIAYFKTRIELKQIGYREDARICGGIGVCGREFCCHAVFDRLKSITIKMAKEQKLSLNTNKISGPCEKLLCCLAYEHDFYMEQAKLLPPEGYKITYQGTLWKIIELNLLLGMATLETEDGKKTMLPKTQFEKNNDRWFVKNSGKGKGEKILQ